MNTSFGGGVIPGIRSCVMFYDSFSKELFLYYWPGPAEKWKRGFPLSSSSPSSSSSAILGLCSPFWSPSAPDRVSSRLLFRMALSQPVTLSLFCGSFPQDTFSEKGLANNPIATVTRAKRGVPPSTVRHFTACEHPTLRIHITYLHSVWENRLRRGDDLSNSSCSRKGPPNLNYILWNIKD